MITLTERAAQHVHEFLARHAAGQHLRLAVKPTGCSGYKYVVEPTAVVHDHDRVFESRGVRVVIDAESLRYLEGTEIDYAREGLSAGLRFTNPNVKETCGCGESFSIEAR
jgi:iron-sulfur cluster assembly protein